MKSRTLFAVAAALSLSATAACGGGGGASSTDAAKAHGAIRYPNNAQEVV
jgi:hypothetical protein